MFSHSLGQHFSGHDVLFSPVFVTPNLVSPIICAPLRLLARQGMGAPLGQPCLTKGHRFPLHSTVCHLTIRREYGEFMVINGDFMVMNGDFPSGKLRVCH